MLKRQERGADAGYGADEKAVKTGGALVDGSEYKASPVAAGIKITGRAFGRDRRLPITNKFHGNGPGAIAGQLYSFRVITPQYVHHRGNAGDYYSHSAMRRNAFSLIRRWAKIPALTPNKGCRQEPGAHQHCFSIKQPVIRKLAG
jgi:hypothetical protein